MFSTTLCSSDLIRNECWGGWGAVLFFVFDIYVFFMFGPNHEPSKYSGLLFVFLYFVVFSEIISFTHYLKKLHLALVLKLFLYLTP